MSPEPAKCSTCRRKPNEAWMCSHIECPNRKPITAQPPDFVADGLVPPRDSGYDLE